MKKILITLSILICLAACKQGICKDDKCATPAAKSTAVVASAAVTDTTALVCKLTSAQMQQRRQDLEADVFKNYEKVNELPEAMEFVYADGKKYAPILVDFINTERDCCPFFTFRLTFAPNSEKIALTVGGSAKMKEMVKTLIN